MTGDRVLGEWLRTEAAEDPHRDFFQCGGPWVTLAQLDAQSDTVAAGLQAQGAVRGDRVAIILPNSVDYVLCVYGIAKAGAVQVPINTYLRGEMLHHQLAESGASIVICDSSALAHLLPLLDRLPALGTVVLVGEQPERRHDVIAFENLMAGSTRPDRVVITPDDLCVIMYTSGTTGASKGCRISHGYYCAIAKTFIDHGWFHPGDRIFGASPLFHFTGQVTVVANALAAGGSAVLEPQFHASSFLERAREVRATALFGVGAMGAAILAQEPDPIRDRDHTIRQATWIPMSAVDQKRFTERFAIPVLSEIYGQSECWPATISHADDAHRRPGSLGLPLSYMDLRLVDDDGSDVPVGVSGEILLRPRIPRRMFDGYWNNPAATAEAARDGWHHTGDNGRLDPDGSLYFVDRKKDCLRRRGENVSSMELERAILGHPAVAAVAVHAVPSPLGEDDIKACIVPVGTAGPAIEDLFAFFKDELPYYAIPRYVEIVSELPLTQTLRVQKHKLRERGITASTIDLEAVGLVVPRDERR